MGTEDNNGDMRFQNRDGESMFKAPIGAEPYFSLGWDPLVSLGQSENFGAPADFSNPAYPVALENQAMSGTSHLVHYQSDSGLGEMVPKISSFGSGSFPEMVNSFGLPECGMNYSQNKEECRNSEDKASPNGKKKRKSSEFHSPFNPSKNAEVEQQQDPSGESLEQDEKKQKNINVNSRGKQAGKQAIENSDSGDAAAKENYIHVRAKRGQATNSHSLAERVRRERISERMRLLQELVPGCNKITGKAVMLDEIINYVQSLQQQVEFLSMKLATVNPELNIDIERILSKDILNSRGGNAAILGFPGMSPAHPFPHGSLPLPSIPSTTPPFHSMPQTVWDHELHNLLQMGFDANNNLGPAGRSKLDL